MNFSPFGSPFASPASTIHQFTAKLTQENASAVAENSSRYTANGIPSFIHHHHATTPNNSAKYNSYLNAQSPSGTSSTANSNKKQLFFVDRQHQELAQELCNALLQNQHDKTSASINLEEIKLIEDVKFNPNILSQTQSSSSSSQAWQTLASNSSSVVDYLSQLPAPTIPLSLHHFLKYSAESFKKDTQNLQSNNESNSGHSINVNLNNISNIFNLSNNDSNQNSSNAQDSTELDNLSTINVEQLNQCNEETAHVSRKTRKKKPEKVKQSKPKPGEIRLTTALDGSTLYCCPECHMAYPEKELLEQHLLGHTLERRFVCDICGAGLKRKDHLTRHKQSHNPERPYICSVCLKAFKRKEQLTLHFVIHSGEKRHICTECGKGFYRKDHLRKHTRSHIARRVKSELTHQGTTLPSLSTVNASNMMS